MGARRFFIHEFTLHRFKLVGRQIKGQEVTDRTVTLSTGSQDMRTRSYTHSQSHILAEVGDIEDVRSVS